MYIVHINSDRAMRNPIPHTGIDKTLNSEDVRDEVGLRDDTAFKNCNDPIDFTACEVFLRFPASSGG